MLIISGIYGYSWYQYLPRPELITAKISAPESTPNTEKQVPNKLIIDFGIKKDSFINKSVAPLKWIGKEVTGDVVLNPAMLGKWIWESDSTLVFTPEQDWPAGQTYNLHFKPTFFATKVKLQSLSYSFTTEPFEMTLREFKFYQDPIQPSVRQGVATLDFNYPVDTKSLADKTTLMFQAIKNGKQNSHAKPVKYTLDYDQHKRTAYIHSEALPIPEITRYLALKIGKGVKPLFGPGVTEEDLKENLLIPDAKSYLKISQIQANIMRNSRDQPEQILTIETTLGIAATELNKNVHAYLLPAYYPATKTEKIKWNYYWHNPGEVTPEILSLATPLALQPLPTQRDFATLHSYKLNVETQQFIYLKIDKGTRGFGDFVLANDYMAIIKVPNYPKEISFLHKGALLALNSEKKLSVTVRGLPAVKFTLARVQPDAINHLVSQTAGSFSDPFFANYRFNQNNISEIFTDIRQFDAMNLAKQQYTALDLGKYLAAKSNPSGPLGLFLLQANGFDPIKKVALNAEASRLILVTDLGLLVKDNVNGSHDVFVQSITQGVPVANASITVLGKNGLPIATRTTDSQGHVNFYSLKDFIDEHEPMVYLAQRGNDVSFIPYKRSERQLNYSRFDVGGVVTNHQETTSLSAQVFSDRGMYRPGDMAHIAMIVKQAYAQAQPAGLPLEVTITDPRGMNVLSQKIILNSTGYFTLDFQSTSTSPTGSYTVNLFIVKDNRPSSLLGSTSFRIAEFLPDRLRIAAHFSASPTPGWISPIELNAQVDLMNLYGAPAAGQKISTRMLLSPQAVKFNQFPQYTFTDPLLDPKKPQKVLTDVLTDIQTNNQGQADIPLKLERFAKTTYQLSLFAEGFEAAGGRSVSTQITTLVSPLAYLVGYKSDGDLNYIKQNSERSIHFIAINPTLQQEAHNGLKLQLYALHPVTTLVKKEDGTFQYQSLMQTSLIRQNPFAISLQGTDCILPSDQIGDFILELADQNGTVLSRLQYSIVGAAQKVMPKNAELRIKLNKSEYLPDQDVEMEIHAPYTGAGLITIERDKVYAYQWFQAKTTHSIQKIHIPKDFQGDGYINVAFVRDWNSPEIFMSPLSNYVLPFSVNRAKHAVNIHLDIPELARPGEPLLIHYNSDKPGKVIVFAVDEGILQVARFSTPDPLGFFFKKRALEVETQQIVDQILPKFISERELSAVGGDQGKAELSKYLNPFKRKTDIPVAYWSGIVDMDDAPRTLSYFVPDYFNGKLRIMAVAVAPDAVGSAEKSTQIRGDFIIQPNVPTFVGPGDEFEVTANIANNIQNSGRDAEIAIQLTLSPQLELLSPPQQTLKISANQAKTAQFKLRAKAELGAAHMTFVAGWQNKSNKMAATLSVRPASHYLTTIASGHSREVNKTLALDRVLYPEDRLVEASVSTNPLILVFGLQQYLDNFPYGCTEQLISKVFPLLALTGQTRLAPDKKTLVDKIQTTMDMLSQRQMTDGGFSYWPNTRDNKNNSFASVYAMHFLTEARSHGYEIPREMFSQGISYLKELASQNVVDLDQARVQAYAIYILTRNEMVTTNYLTHLQLNLAKAPAVKWQKDIVSIYLAATYQLLKSDTEARRIINLYQPSMTNPISSDFYSKAIADAEYLYLMARHFPERLSKSGNDLVQALVRVLNQGEMNTVLASYASLALTAYAEAYQSLPIDHLELRETLTGDKQKKLMSGGPASIDIHAQKIHFLNPDKQPYFYQLNQTGFDQNPPNKIIAQNLEIYREYRNAEQQVMSTVELGQELEVHIRVRALNAEHYNNIAVVDLLPGGFEVVSDSVHSNNMDYADIREDRVVFFGSVGPDTLEIVYRIKATNAGQYAVPAVFATSMYNSIVQARGEIGRIHIKRQGE